MTAAVKTLIQAHPVGKNSLLSTNIPFLDRNNPDAFTRRFREDFQPFSTKKLEPFPPPILAQVDHKDLRHIKEYLTETMEFYHRHPLPQITRAPPLFYTNFKMQTDPGEVTFLTTQSQKFGPRPFQPPPTPIRHTEATKKIQHVEKHPESTSRAAFTPHHSCPVVKATSRHLEEGFPTIKGDRRRHSFASQYRDSFQGAWTRAAEPVKEHPSLALGDPVKILERETTHAASFSRPTICSPPVVKKPLKLNLGHFSKDFWLSTTRETFCHQKLGDPVVVTRRKQNSSSLPKGDTDVRRNKERMSVTTNSISFSDQNHKERPVHMRGADLMTKSNIHFSPPCLSGLYYTTTAKEHYSKQDGERARLAIPLPSNILSGPELELKPSITKSDFLPVTACRQTPCPSVHTSNIRFPLVHQHFSTTHSEYFTAKPLIVQRPAYSQFRTHFVMK